jgi:hypothetical protein
MIFRAIRFFVSHHARVRQPISHHVWRAVDDSHMLLWRWAKRFSNDEDTNVQFLPKRKLLLPNLGRCLFEPVQYEWNLRSTWSSDVSKHEHDPHFCHTVCISVGLCSIVANGGLITFQVHTIRMFNFCLRGTYVREFVFATWNITTITTINLKQQLHGMHTHMYYMLMRWLGGKGDCLAKKTRIAFGRLAQILTGRSQTTQHQATHSKTLSQFYLLIIKSRIVYSKGCVTGDTNRRPILASA